MKTLSEHFVVLRWYSIVSQMHTVGMKAKTYDVVAAPPSFVFHGVNERGLKEFHIVMDAGAELADLIRRENCHGDKDEECDPESVEEAVFQSVGK